MWGGHSKDFHTYTGKSELASSSSVHRFDPLMEIWVEPSECSGVPPSGFFGGNCAYASHQVYVYGGLANDSHYHGFLHQLDTRSWTWKQLASVGPMRKAGSKMVVYDGKLVLFRPTWPHSARGKVYKNRQAYRIH